MTLLTIPQREAVAATMMRGERQPAGGSGNGPEVDHRERQSERDLGHSYSEEASQRKPGASRASGGESRSQVVTPAPEKACIWEGGSGFEQTDD